MKAAFEFRAWLAENTVVLVSIDAGLFVEKLNIAVEAVATEINQSPALIVNPVFDSLIHLLRPVLGVSADDENFVAAQIEPAEMQLRLGVVVVAKALPFHPSEQPPFGRGQVAACSTDDRIVDPCHFRNRVDRFRPVE